MTTTDSSSPAFGKPECQHRTSRHLTRRALLGVALALTGPTASVLAQTPSAHIVSLRADRADDGVYLAASLKLSLPAPVEDALTKGIALYFVADVDITRDRWYWTDSRVLSTSRTWRVAFQPLARRWRLTVSSGEAALTQSFETLNEALATMTKIPRWRLADAEAIDGAPQRHNLSFRFRLDASQLPRPFQIGVVGQADWTVQVARVIRLNTAP